jgi:hypothetical protein
MKHLNTNLDISEFYYRIITVSPQIRKPDKAGID